FFFLTVLFLAVFFLAAFFFVARFFLAMSRTSCVREVSEQVAYRIAGGTTAARICNTIGPKLEVS
ncbi:MAG: hypothetical protein ACYS0G_14400, partial [Planctomycetota bacterium]